MTRQQALTQIKNLTNNKSNAVGALGELYVSLLLFENDIDNKIFINNGYDILLTNSNVRVDVKTARETKNGYNFCVGKNDKHGFTSHKASDYLILVFVGGGLVKFALIPTVILPDNQKNIRVRDTSKGKWATYIMPFNSIIKHMGV